MPPTFQRASPRASANVTEREAAQRCAAVAGNARPAAGERRLRVERAGEVQRRRVRRLREPRQRRQRAERRRVELELPAVVGAGVRRVGHAFEPHAVAGGVETELGLYAPAAGAQRDVG